MRSYLAALVALLFLAGCQILAGYEDFKGPSGAASAGSAGQAGSGGSSSGGAGGDAAGMSGSSGQAGTGGQGDVCQGKTPPSDTLGAPMVAVPIGKYDQASNTTVDQLCAWVDAAEVTFAQYQEFLTKQQVDPGTPGTGSVIQSTECKDLNKDLNPDGACLAGQDPQGEKTFTPRKDPDFPVVCVDWCDASAYCKWAGKELCSDGPSADPFGNPMYMACTGGGVHVHPHQTVEKVTAVSGLCNDLDFKNATCPAEDDGHCALPTGLADECKTASGVADLVGNAAEWQGSCDASGCRVRGGSFLQEGSKARCTDVLPFQRAHLQGDIGFRCCSTRQD